MERIEIYKVKKGFTKISMTTGLIVFIVSLPLLIYRLIDGFRIGFPDGDWNFVLVPVLGIIYFLSGYQMLKFKKFFIEWDDEKLEYFLPKNKKTVTIKFSDIRNVEMNLTEIKVLLPEKEITMDLRNIPFKELMKIKEKFKEIRRNTNSGFLE